MAALARNYARLAASLLITLAIERHRSRYQDPLIARASDLFAALTGKSFAGLALDYREDVLTLVTARADGQRVPIAGFSKGTRDQLYLALRLPALGEFAARVDPRRRVLLCRRTQHAVTWRQAAYHRAMKRYEQPIGWRCVKPQAQAPHIERQG